MIRPARIEDTESLVSMGVRFYESSPYRSEIEASDVEMRHLIGLMLQSPQAGIVVAESGDRCVVGMIGMSVFVHPLSMRLAAHEVFWWVNPEARKGRTAIRLLHAGEAWAKAAGAEVVQMVAPDAKTGAIYERLGYRPIETMYQRRLS